MALPLFPPERDPGPDFVGLLRLTAGGPDGDARPLAAGLLDPAWLVEIEAEAVLPVPELQFGHGAGTC